MAAAAALAPASLTSATSPGNAVRDLPISPPKLIFTIPSFREVTDDPKAFKSYIGYNCKLEIIYPPECTKPNATHTIVRRWSHFEKFDSEWEKVYPAVHTKCHLPIKKLPSLILNKHKLADSRRLVLQQYISHLLTVNCLQEFVAQFLEIEFSLLKSYEINQNAVPKPTQNNTLLSQFGITASSNTTNRIATVGTGGGAVSLDGSAESEVAAVAETIGFSNSSSPAPVVMENGYVREGPEIRGNTDVASKLAHKTKAKFLDENKRLLDAMIKLKAQAGVFSIKLNLPFIGTSVTPAQTTFVTPTEDNVHGNGIIYPPDHPIWKKEYSANSETYSPPPNNPLFMDRNSSSGSGYSAGVSPGVSRAASTATPPPQPQMRPAHSTPGTNVSPTMRSVPVMNGVFTTRPPPPLMSPPPFGHPQSISPIPSPSSATPPPPPFLATNSSTDSNGSTGSVGAPPPLTSAPPIGSSSAPPRPPPGGRPGMRAPPPRDQQRDRSRSPSPPPAPMIQTSSSGHDLTVLANGDDSSSSSSQQETVVQIAPRRGGPPSSAPPSNAIRGGPPSNPPPASRPALPASLLLASLAMPMVSSPPAPPQQNGPAPPPLTSPIMVSPPPPRPSPRGVISDSESSPARAGPPPIENRPSLAVPPPRPSVRPPSGTFSMNGQPSPTAHSAPPPLAPPSPASIVSPTPVSPTPIAATAVISPPVSPRNTTRRGPPPGAPPPGALRVASPAIEASSASTSTQNTAVSSPPPPMPPPPIQSPNAPPPIPASRPSFAPPPLPSQPPPIGARPPPPGPRPR